MTFDPSISIHKFTTSPEWLRETKSMLREFHKCYSVEKLYPILNGIEQEVYWNRTAWTDNLALQQAYQVLRRQ